MLDIRSISSPDDSLQKLALILSYIVIVLATIALGLRLWSIRLRGLSLSFSDYALLLAWPFTVGVVATATISIIYGGAGQHQQSLSSSDLLTRLPFLEKSSFATGFLWITAITLVKLSILSLYHQIFPLPRFRLLIYALSFLVFAFFLGIILTQFLICQPLAKEWDASVSGTCGDEEAYTMAFSIFDVLSDVSIFVAPMPVISRLHMPLKRKAMLAAVFGVGCIICIVTILRVIESANTADPDTLYRAGALALYCVLEPALGIVNACLPTMKPAVKKIAGFVRGESSQNHHTVSSGPDTPAKKIAEKGRRHELGDSLPLTDVTLDTQTGSERNPESFEAVEPFEARNNGPIIPRRVRRSPFDAQDRSHHGLQDYQIQLMLQEQQNKKLLLMARQDYENRIRPNQAPETPGQPGFTSNMSPSGSSGTPEVGQVGLPESLMPDDSMPGASNSPNSQSETSDRLSTRFGDLDDLINPRGRMV